MRISQRIGVGVIAAAALGTSAMLATPALAVNDAPGQHTSSTTTLDACGYFIGTQTANKTTNSGATSTEKGTWAGVSNNYGYGPVASLGPVTGSYTETVTSNSDGSIDGTEYFKSNAGQINQTFAYASATGWHVSVSATGSLSFLTSDTNGACYTGTFPRP